MKFALDTAVKAIDNGYAANIVDGWDVGGNANGGYLMAIGARAMAAAAGRAHPVALSAHFLTPAGPGPIRITPSAAKSGRRFATVRASMAAPEKPLVELLGSFAELEGIEGPVRIDAQPPDLPPPEECVSLQPDPRGFPPNLLANIDLRLHPDDAKFVSGQPSGRPLFRGWLRLIDEPVDAFALLLAVDVFPPTVFNANMPIGWTPTLELTAHVRGQPQPGWLRCRFSTRFITGGMLEEDGEVWDESGRLVAQSRQLALIAKT